MKKMVLIIAIAIAVLFGCNTLSRKGNAVGEVKMMSVEELNASLDHPALKIIDVRTDSDWGSSDRKVPGAVRENFRDVSAWVRKYSRSDRMVLYCA